MSVLTQAWNQPFLQRFCLLENGFRNQGVLSALWVCLLVLVSFLLDPLSWHICVYKPMDRYMSVCTHIHVNTHIYRLTCTCCCSVTQLYPTLCDPMNLSLSFSISRSLLCFMSIELVTPSNHLVLCRPLLLLPSVFPHIRVFSSESALHIKWPKYWSFSFSISPSKEYPGLVSFRMDWFDPLVVQRTLKSLLQHHSSKASILWLSFFMVQLSYPYMTTGKTIALTRWTLSANWCLHFLIHCLGLS